MSYFKHTAGRAADYRAGAVADSVCFQGRPYLEISAQALLLAGPALADWAWATGHLSGLFAPVDRITPAKYQAYMEILRALPPGSRVEVMWELDTWLLPLAKTYRPDIAVNITACRWTRSEYYVYTPPYSGQWYLPCILEVGPPPGVLIMSINGTGLYKS
ncbi:hypothetical protein [Thermoproteus tenax]|uniref:hypothetical protein n=1 Tax=Thermoproteus tenax TaxID=2271 RepID=UPI00069B634F|nr:hypothetical protein [Thermoproteus tenax]